MNQARAKADLVPFTAPSKYHLTTDGAKNTLDGDDDPMKEFWEKVCSSMMDVRRPAASWFFCVDLPPSSIIPLDMRSYRVF